MGQTTKKRKGTILFENHKLKGSNKKVKYAVARDSKGRLRGRRRVAGTGLNKTDFYNIWNKNKTFYDHRTREKLTNKSRNVDIHEFKPNNLDSKPLKRPRNSPKGHYFVRGTVEGKTITRTSLKLGSPTCETTKLCKEYALNKFLLAVGDIVSGDYNKDVGLHDMGSVTNLKQGWIYFN